VSNFLGNSWVKSVCGDGLPWSRSWGNASRHSEYQCACAGGGLTVSTVAHRTRRIPLQAGMAARTWPAASAPSVGPVNVTQGPRLRHRPPQEP